MPFSKKKNRFMNEIIESLREISALPEVSNGDMERAMSNVLLITKSDIVISDEQKSAITFLSGVLMGRLVQRIFDSCDDTTTAVNEISELKNRIYEDLNTTSS